MGLRARGGLCKQASSQETLGSVAAASWQPLSSRTWRRVCLSLCLSVSDWHSVSLSPSLSLHLSLHLSQSLALSASGRAPPQQEPATAEQTPRQDRAARQVFSAATPRRAPPLANRPPAPRLLTSAPEISINVPTHARSGEPPPGPSVSSDSGTDGLGGARMGRDSEREGTSGRTRWGGPGHARRHSTLQATRIHSTSRMPPHCARHATMCG